MHSLKENKRIGEIPSWVIDDWCFYLDWFHHLKCGALCERMDYPPFSAEKKDVLMFFRSGQPSHLLKALGEHCATLSGSQGLSERSWARLSRQCTPLRNSLLASTKQTLMNLATTAILWVQCGVPDPNREHVSSVWRAGPQPRAREFSVASRTPTAILWVQCGVPDPNRDPVSSVWRAGPQVLCQKKCQKDMREDMSEEMSEEMS